MDFTQYLDKEIFRVVAKAAEASGVDVYVVGGYVRDLVLGRPSKDIDFVCVGSGIALAKKVAALLGPGIQANYFGNFGTAQIRYGDLDIEFVGARKESMVPWRTI